MFFAASHVTRIPPDLLEKIYHFTLLNEYNTTSRIETNTPLPRDSTMSHIEDYTTNIDEQLLLVVKNQVSADDYGHHSSFKHEDKDHHLHHHLQTQLQVAQQAAQALYHQNPIHDDSEYNIQIPEPVILQRLKIYPVDQNTITNEGNLITRPIAEHHFHTREDLNDFIADFARHNGFGIVIAHSNKKAIYYTCELGGRYRHKKGKTIQQQEEEAAQRQLNETGNGYVLDQHARTKKLRCPFLMTALFRKLTLEWVLRATCNEHNHPMLDPLCNHPMLRKRSDELNLLILELYRRGTKPSHIEAKIKHQYKDIIIKREDIYNEIRGYKRKMKRQNKFLPAPGSPSDPGKARHSLNYDHVRDEENELVLAYDLEQQRHEELEHQLQAVAVAAEAHYTRQRMNHLLSHHDHLDHLHLQQYQLSLQGHSLDDTDDNSAAAVIASAARNSTQSDLSIDNIDSRLVGE
ncbi:hypothetical protein PUMCH_004065 [Australozyma saopauloensis]|uniref:FAR1 domain-containing protein n=1 Tax=Australozyma saopauloensis TaxID=291208 RepID=A0AAX4HDS5_9ASCO|nr:hypothetical protein PUMCH_004065 [[Candida] saopauloensis]